MRRGLARAATGRRGPPFRCGEALVVPDVAQRLPTRQPVEPFGAGFQDHSLLVLHVQDQVQHLQHLTKPVGLFPRFEQREKRQEARYRRFRLRDDVQDVRAGFR